MRAPRPSWTRTPELDPAPALLLDWLISRFPRVSESVWRQRMERGLVTDGDGRPLSPDSPFVPQRRVGYFREVPEEPPAEGELDILHQDDRLVVVDKPPFFPVTPSGPWVGRSLLYRLVELLGRPELTPIHRLDRATSGVVLFASRAEGAHPYMLQFQKGTVERDYEALAAVPERPSRTRWTVTNRIAAGDPFFRRRVVNGPPNATTHLELLDWREGCGHFHLRPESGKQHQLRIHLAGLGWPVLGERYYPELQPKRPDDPEDPLRLVARRLSIVDPHDGRRLTFTSGFRLDPERRALVRDQSSVET